MKIQVLTDSEFVLDVGDVSREDNGVLIEMDVLARIDRANLCHLHSIPSIDARENVDWLIVAAAAEGNDDGLLARSGETIINECHCRRWLSVGSEELEGG